MKNDQAINPETLKKIRDIASDFYRYTKNNLKIKNKDAQIVPLVLNTPQEILVEYVLDCFSKGKPAKAIVLKARQMGLSTVIEALIQWRTTTNKNISSLIVGHEEESSRSLYQMFRRFLDNSNPLFKPSVQYDTKKDITFQKKDKQGNNIGLGSVIRTATAGNKSIGRSTTNNCMHGSEVAFWEDGEKLLGGLMETIPEGEFQKTPSLSILESTANGRGNFFHTQWEAAVSGASNYTPFFFPWWVLSEYEIHNDEDMGELSTYESYLVELLRNGIDVGIRHVSIPEDKIIPKIKFYRKKSKNFVTDPQKMFEEYPSTAEEAFIYSGSPVFNAQALKDLSLKELQESEIEHYDVVLSDKWEDSSIEFREFKPEFYGEHKGASEFGNGRLKIYTKPITGRSYVIGADVAEGLATGDWSIADVVDPTTMQTVARWRGHCEPADFGNILAAIGKYYNNALIGVEINNHGLTTVQRLRDTFYTNLYKREKGEDLDFETTTAHLGWKTDKRTKRLMLDALIKLVNNGTVRDYDKDFIKEAFSFVRKDNGVMAAEKQAHDDVVMAKAIAYQLFDWQNEYRDNLKMIRPAGIVKIKQRNRR